MPNSSIKEGGIHMETYPLQAYGIAAIAFVWAVAALGIFANIVG